MEWTSPMKPRGRPWLGRRGRAWLLSGLVLIAIATASPGTAAAGATAPSGYAVTILSSLSPNPNRTAVDNAAGVNDLGLIGDATYPRTWTGDRSPTRHERAPRPHPSRPALPATRPARAPRPRMLDATGMACLGTASGGTTLVCSIRSVSAQPDLYTAVIPQCQGQCQGPPPLRTHPRARTILSTSPSRPIATTRERHLTACSFTVSPSPPTPTLLQIRPPARNPPYHEEKL
jgi:hypothetical protein